jgi:hypothetical protein
MRASKSPPTYRSYLLRLWRADNAGHPVWRASLEEPGSQTQLHFESLAALCAYLAEQAGGSSKEEPASNQKKGESG